MNVLVLLAGVVDPKWPLAVAGGVEVRAVSPDGGLRLGPFDESALEIALKLRDRHPDTRVDVLVCGGPEHDALARQAAAFRPTRLCRLDLSPAQRWSARRVAAALITVIDAPGAAPDLVLIGREFGDSDDGMLPPFLAEAWGWRFVGMVQSVARDEDLLVLRRERGDVDEAIHLPAPVLASVTNDRSNRLRHPLMKNLAAAKQAMIEVLPVRAMEEGEASLALVGAELAPAAASSRGHCRLLSAGSAADLDAFAQYLAAWTQRS